MDWPNLTLAWSTELDPISSQLGHKTGPKAGILEGLGAFLLNLSKLCILSQLFCRQFQGSAKTPPYLLFFLGLSEIVAFLMWWPNQGVSPEGPQQESEGGCLTPH